MGIIFDLDQTLIDSSALEGLRKTRQWSKVYRQISTIPVYDYMDELFTWLYSKNIPIAIVTNSPESYCKRIIQFNKWRIDATVCYHDVKKRKPHPEPMNLALQKLGIGNENILSIGDRNPDIISSKQAGITSVAALWGTEEREILLQANPDYIAETVKDLHDIVVSFYN